MIGQLRHADPVLVTADPPGVIGSTILTFTGHYFDVLRPEASVIDHRDIAHALSNVCRFGGHVREFYSVAQHCVLASHLVPAEHAFAALMHEGGEAYVGDMPAPIKRLIPDYKRIEKNIEAAVFARFMIPYPMHPCIKEADLRLLKAERAEFMPETGGDWPGMERFEPLPFGIHALPPAKAEWLWLERFDELTQVKVAA